MFCSWKCCAKNKLHSWVETLTSLSSVVMCSATSPALTLTQNKREKKKGKLLKTPQNSFGLWTACLSQTFILHQGKGTSSICLTSKVALFSQQCVFYTGIIASINNRVVLTRSKDSHKNWFCLHPRCISYAVFILLFFFSPK